MSCDVKLCDVTSCHVMSSYVMSRHVMSRLAYALVILHECFRATPRLVLKPFLHFLVGFAPQILSYWLLLCPL